MKGTRNVTILSDCQATARDIERPVEAWLRVSYELPYTQYHFSNTTAHNWQMARIEFAIRRSLPQFSG